MVASYEAERRPIAARNVHEAAGNLDRMLSSRAFLPPREIFEPGSAGDQARKAFGDHYTETMKREWFTIGIQLGYHYENSSICVADGTPCPADEVTEYTPTARPGHRAPHYFLADKQSTLDFFGREFVLLRFGTEPVSGEGIRLAAEKRRVPFRIADIADRQAAALYERRLVLVRPDGHVAWRDDREPADPNLLIDIIRGAGQNSATQA